jgi:hypothetical protein
MIAITLVFLAGTAGAGELETSLDVGMGYRTDKLDSSASGFVRLVNGTITSTPEYVGVNFEDLTTIYSKASVRMSYKNFRVRGSLGYGRTIDGNYRYSTYSDPAHQSETRSRTADADGYVFDASIGLGYQLTSGEVSVTPLIGYSWNLQHLQTNGGIFNGTMAVPNFIVTNELRWQGPWLGLDFNFQPSDEARLYLTAEYHFGDYKALTTWHAEWRGYDQIADAEGFVLSAGFTYTIKDSWDIGLDSQYAQWTTDGGVHGLRHFEYDTLNEANWKSLYVMLNVTHRFYELNADKKLSRL